MNRYMVLLALGVSLSLIFASSMSYADGNEDRVTLSTAPNVTVSLANNTTVNVSYSELFVGTSQGVVGAALGAQNWNITKTSSGFLYRSAFDLQPVAGSDSADLYRSIMNLSDSSFVGNDSTTSLPVIVTITVSHYNGSISTLNVKNITGLGNNSITNINISTLKLSFNISFNLTAQMVLNGSTNVVIVQSLHGSDSSSEFDAEQVDTYERSSELGNGIALMNNSISDLRAVYWWNNNFTYNGNNGKDYAVMVPGDSINQVAFVFNTPASQGIYNLTQDPYLSVNGANLVGRLVFINTQPVINFFLQHIEFYAAGIAVGSVAFMVLYSAYRKNRIRI